MLENRNIDDVGWREATYLDHLRAKRPDGSDFQPICGVERVRFAKDQPAPFELFAGSYADLGVRFLGLPEQRLQEIRYALVSDGLRVPGTRYVMRVTRP